MSRSPVAKAPVGAGSAQHLEGGETRSRGDGVAAQGAELQQVLVRSHPTGIEVGRDVLAPGDGGERIAPAEHLAEGAHVRDDAVVRLRAAIREPKAGDDLVEHQRHVVPGGQLPHPLQETGPGRKDALHGLHQHPGEGVSVLAKDAAKVSMSL